MVKITGPMKSLRKKGYIFVAKGSRVVTFSENNAKKEAKEIRKQYGYNARVVKLVEKTLLNEDSYTVMYKIKKRK